MRRPNVDRWCARFVVALVKNLPKVETSLRGDEVVTLAMSFVKRTVERMVDESKKRKEVIKMKKPVKKPAAKKPVAKPAKKCGKCKK